MRIHWIKCSERMPPDDHRKIIVRDKNGLRKRKKKIMVLYYRLCKHNQYEWIPYDEETWRKLNDTRN